MARRAGVPHITARLTHTAAWLRTHPEVSAAGIALVSHYSGGHNGVMLEKRGTRTEAAQLVVDLLPVLGRPTQMHTGYGKTHVWWKLHGDDIEVSVSAPGPRRADVEAGS